MGVVQVAVSTWPSRRRLALYVCTPGRTNGEGDF